MKKYPCIESTLDISVGPKVIRLWIDRTTNYELFQSIDSIGQLVKDYMIENPHNTDDQIIDYIAETVEHINAVQVLSANFVDGIKNGTVAYTVAFENDIHG